MIRSGDLPVARLQVFRPGAAEAQPAVAVGLNTHNQPVPAATGRDDLLPQHGLDVSCWIRAHTSASSLSIHSHLV